MRKKLLTMGALLTLAAVSTTILAMTVLADSGNPGGDDSRHPDHSEEDHEANKIVGVPCATGSHTKHVESGGIVTVTEHIHHATWFWYDSDEDESHSQQEERVVKIACGDVPHTDNDTDITSWGNHGTVGWDSDDDKFTFTGDDDTGLGKYTFDRVDYCNGLIDDGNDGAYSPFAGVPDLCNRFFVDVREAVRPPPSGGM